MIFHHLRAAFETLGVQICQKIISKSYSAYSKWVYTYFRQKIKICVPFKQGKNIARIDFSLLFDFSIVILRHLQLIYPKSYFVLEFPVFELCQIQIINSLRYKLRILKEIGTLFTQSLENPLTPAPRGFENNWFINKKVSGWNGICYKGDICKLFC